MEPVDTRDTQGLPRVARAAFALLFALMVVNYLDRQVVVSMFVPLQSTWELSDSQLGLLVSIVSIMVAVGAVPLSLLADRWNRVYAIVAMAVAWSIATAASSLASSFATLVGARAIVGLGEAAFGAVGVALLASLFPPQRRSFVFGAFFVASILGTVLGVVLGGILVQHWGWRATFMMAGIPGIVLALALLVQMRGHRDATAGTTPGATPRMPLGAMLAAAIRPRTVVLACVGAGLQLAPVAMIYAWMPSYLQRYFALDARGAGFVAGIFLVASGAGVLASSALADRLARRIPTARLLVPALGALGTVALFTPAFWLMPPGALQLAVVSVGSVVMMASLGPVAAVVQDVVPGNVRATAAAVLAVVQNLVGLAGGPLLVGVLSDRLGLQAALTLVPLACLPAAAFFLLARRTHAEDVRRAADTVPRDRAQRAA